jgi:type I restriction-modification system DNA methylase subunit
MAINLKKEEKAQIISSHIKNLSYQKYNLEIDLLQENAKASPSQSSLENFNTQISEVENQIEALETELVAVNALAE